MKRRTLRDLLRCIRGSATTEAVIMLPFFAIVWGCIIYCSHRYERATEVQAVARGCAWRHAKDNCDTDTRCSISPGADVSDTTEIQGDIASAQSSAGDWGAIGSVIDLLSGQDITATYNGSVQKPEVIGGGTANLVGQMALTCNIAPSGDLGDIISGAWNQLWTF
jgi:hypothetical protein